MESAFQFTNPTLMELILSLNSGFDSASNKEVQIKFSLSINVERDKDKSEAVVSLLIEIGEQNDSSPFWIKAEERANFRWEDDLDDKIIERLLKQNAPSLLLAYLRPVIAQVTMASPYGVYNIPFINFTK